MFRLAGGDELRFADARRFGWVEPARAFAASPALARVGPDPLTALDAPALAAALAGARAPIKAFLMDQRRVAGLGNIYVAEALHRAGIHPARRPGACGRARLSCSDAIRTVLEGGIARRGTTLRDYVDADGRSGDNARRAAGLRARGRALSALWRAHQTARRRRSRDVFLSGLPATVSVRRRDGRPHLG